MKHKNNLVDYYRDLFSYLSLVSYFIYTIFFVFLFAILIGFFVPVPEQINERIFDMITEMFSKAEGKGFFGMFVFIFLNNLIAGFFGMFFGIASGFLSLFYSFFNGYIVGFVSFFVVEKVGFFYLWRLFPHGIFELPEIFISLGLGLNLGISLLKRCIYLTYPKIKRFNFSVLMLFGVLFFPISFLISFIYTFNNKKLLDKFLYDINKSISIFLLIVIPLLFIGALIESVLIIFTR